MTNAREIRNQFRRLTQAEAEVRGVTRGARFISSETGQEITRRQLENIRAETMEIPGGLTGMQRLTAKVQGYGFRSAAQLYQLQSNEMYQALERIYSLHAGGIPENQIRTLQPIADDFNRAMGQVIASGEWKYRTDPDYAKFGKGLTTARLGPNVRHLFEVVGTDSSKADNQKRADWLRLY